MAERPGLERLMAIVIDGMARHYDRRAILRGGMALRLLGASRLTNDLDYLIVPHRSKKELVPEILRVLKEISGEEIAYSFNSKCLRLEIPCKGQVLQIEAKVAMAQPSKAVSNEHLATAHALPPRLVSIMEPRHALAHKMAAWYERRLSRDLYDIWYLLMLGIEPDLTVLGQRLKKPCPIARAKAEGLLAEPTPTAYARFLLARLKVIDDEQLEGDLMAVLPVERIRGLRLRLLVAVTEWAESLRANSDLLTYRI